MDSHAWDERYGGADLIWTADPNRFLVAEVRELPEKARDLGAHHGVVVEWVHASG